MTLVEKYKVVQAVEPKTTNAAITGAYVSLKNVINATVVVNLTQAVGHATVISLYQAQDVSGTGAKTLSNNIPVWANEDVSSGDLLIRKTDGVSYTVANTAKNKQIVFHIDPAKLDINNGFTCLNVRIGASTQVTNFASAEYILDSKYAGDVPSSVVVD
ncbi:hypothetical protein [Clostridium tyrobutyricum]|uniref:hypothetical protein n=1 Tax=Clostridium tyrobutyricum TaxID=1519 RepID=UPI0011CC03C1|nr:hypothetical protein [Clostridium tyrobutyricum]